MSQRREQPKPRAERGKEEPKPSEAQGAEEEGGVAPASAGPTPPTDGGDARPPQSRVSARKGQYLIAKSTGPQPQDLLPLDLNVLTENLRAGREQEIEFVRTVRGRGLDLLADGTSGQQDIIVAKMTAARAEALNQDPRVVVERDAILSLSLPVSAPPELEVRNPGVVALSGEGFVATILVVGKDDTPLEGATVYLFGSVFPAQGLTDVNGQVQLTLFGESPDSIRSLYVKPKADYWSFNLPQPALDPTQITVVSLTPLDQTFRNFPDEQALGWGQRAMKLDQLPAQHRGQGVKVAVIDSGAATTHQDLQRQLKGGYDTVAQSDQTWNEDTIAHGSHCAGVIAGANDARGIRGFAPDAEVYAFKIFPNGRFSNLIEALNHCIERQVDVANLSLGSAERSELVEQKIQEAKQRGIACIVAAGNSGGPVQYPASSANVMAVAAIGKYGEFPEDSYHSTQVFGGNGVVGGGDGYFSAKFTCFGPEIAVAGPGVGIVSSVPPDNYAAWDGTSMAAPHVTGLAALILAHHPDFQGPRAPYRARDARRVERLFQILKESAEPLSLGERNRTGAGIPDALKAFTLTTTARDATTATPTPGVPGSTTQPARAPSSTPDPLRDVLQQIGVLPRDGGGTAPQGAGAGGLAPQTTDGVSTAPPTAGRTGTAADPLRDALQQAGVLSGGAAPQVAGISGGAAPDPLRDALQQAGVLSGSASP